MNLLSHGIKNASSKTLLSITGSGDIVCESNRNHISNGLCTFTLPTSPLPGMKIGLSLNTQYSSSTYVKKSPTSYSGNTGTPAYAFDGSTSTHWTMSVSGTSDGGYLIGIYSANTNANRCRIYCYDDGGNYRNPTNLYVQGYNGSSWITLTSGLTGIGKNAWKTYDFTNASLYSQYRLGWSNNENGATTTVAVTELEFYSSYHYGYINSFVLNGVTLPKIALLSSANCTLTYVNSTTGWIVSSGSFPSYVGA